MELSGFLEKQNRLFWGILGVLLVLLLGIADYLTGVEFNLSLFYLVPIALVAWYAGRELGLITSGISAITWFLADLFAGSVYSHTWLYLWESIIRLGFFVVVTYLLVSLKNALKTNQELARTDFITGAVSIRYFYEIAQKELGRSSRYNHPFTFAYIDLDNFKDINDRFGHTTGDKLLRTVTAVVHKRIRSIDTFARLGGDEFALLMPETGEVEAQAVVSRVRRSLLEEMKRNDWPVTFSIGVVTFIKIPKTVDDMVKMADDVMYPIKTDGKNGVSYTIFEG